MYTSPNARRMIDMVANVLSRDILPHIRDPAAAQKAEMCMSVLRCAEQLIPIEQQMLCRESGEMRDLFIALGQLVEKDESPEAIRIRDRAGIAAQGARIEVPAYDEVMASHCRLSEALIPTLEDLHALDSRDIPLGAQGLALIRGHLAQRSARDREIYLGVPQPGAMAGRD